MTMGAPVFPIRVTVVDQNDNEHVYEPATHIKYEDNTLEVYDGSTQLARWMGHKSFEVEELIPEIEEYKGEGFPL